jgi:hypothetical protein
VTVPRELEKETEMLLDVSTRADNLLDGSATTNDATKTAPVFVTEQSLFSFAGMTAVVQLVWKVFQQGGGGWADSPFLALAIAATVGIAQFVPIVGGRSWGTEWPKVVQAGAFAALNTCVLWAAALGIDENLNG